MSEEAHRQLNAQQMPRYEAYLRHLELDDLRLHHKDLFEQLILEAYKAQVSQEARNASDWKKDLSRALTEAMEALIEKDKAQQVEQSQTS